MAERAGRTFLVFLSLAAFAAASLSPLQARADDPYGPLTVHPPRLCCMGWSYLAGLTNSFDKIVLYGGLNDQMSGVSQNATWLWDPAAKMWSTTAYSISTGAHSSTRMTYDAALLTSPNQDGNIVLYGGINCNGLGSCPVTDGLTWFFHGNADWASCPCVSGHSPTPTRASEALTTDLAGGSSQVVLFGGDSGHTGDPNNALTPQQDTWFLSGTDTGTAFWTPCTSANSATGLNPPSARRASWPTTRQQRGPSCSAAPGEPPSWGTHGGTIRP